MQIMTVTERNLYVLCFASREGIRILESGKFLLVESRIVGFGILNTAQGIRNPTNDWNLESNDQESGIQFWNPESTVYKSNRVMDARGRFQPRPQGARFSLQSQKRRRKRNLSGCLFFRTRAKTFELNPVLVLVLKSKALYCCIQYAKVLLIITGVQASGVIIDRLLRQCCFVCSEIVGPHSSGNFSD